MIVTPVPPWAGQSSNVTEVKEMKRKLLNIAGVSILAAGMALAQDTPAPNARHSHRHGQAAGSMIDRMSAKLNLSSAQKQQAQSIFANARETAQPLRAQLRQEQQALRAAVKAGAPDTQIDQLANQMGPLMAQTTAIQAKAFGKFYSILTPDQQNQLKQRAMNRHHAG